MSEFGSPDSLRRWDGPSWSLSVAHVQGVHLRLHVTLAILLVAVFFYWLGWPGILLSVSLLVALILHEVGHLISARLVGAEITDLLIWPLGNLYGPRASSKPIETTLTLVGGPAANMLACLLTLPVLHATGGISADLWNPLAITSSWRGLASPSTYLEFLFKANLWLALANLLPIYPLDGGRMVRDLIGLRLHPFQASMVTVILGSVGGVLLFGVGLWYHWVWVAALGGACGYLCLRRQRELEFLAENSDNEFGYDFSEGYTSLERSMVNERPAGPPPTLGGSIRQWFEDRRRKQLEMLDAELDRLLAKIHDTGMTSLTRSERRLLALASRRRKR